MISYLRKCGADTISIKCWFYCWCCCSPTLGSAEPCKILQVLQVGGIIGGVISQCCWCWSWLYCRCWYWAFPTWESEGPCKILQVLQVGAELRLSSKQRGRRQSIAGRWQGWKSSWILLSKFNFKTWFVQKYCAILISNLIWPEILHYCRTTGHIIDFLQSREGGVKVS